MHKNIVIVYDKKNLKYANFFSQLLSDKYPKNLEKALIKAQIWDIKQYKDNSPKISSEQYTIFLGNDSFFKDNTSHMQVHYEGFGVSYSWLGKQAALQFNNVVLASQYKYFIEELNKLSSSKTYRTLLEARPEDTQYQSNKTKRAPEGFDFNVLLEQGGEMLKQGGVVLGNEANKGFNLLAQLSKSHELIDQQMTYLILHFFNYGLSEFLNVAVKE